MAGCPTVGVRTGAAFVRDGITGYLVDRLPPGHQCVANEDDEKTLATYLNALSQAQVMDRLTHRCHIFEMNGESYRFRESMKSRKAKKSE